MPDPIAFAADQADALAELEAELDLAERFTEGAGSLEAKAKVLWRRLVGNGEPTPEQHRAFVRQFMPMVNAELSALEAVTSTAVRDGIERSAELAADDAYSLLRVRVNAAAVAKEIDLPFNFVDVALSVRRAVTKASTLEQILTGVGRVQSFGASKAKAMVGLGVTTAAASATEEATTKAGMEKMWVTERNGCLHCLAYNGETTKGDFEGGLTFSVKAKFTESIPKPPLHPNCRCQIVPWDNSWRTDDVSAPEALKREAQRSVLRGWSLPSETEGARLKAAEKLLADRPRLPKTVVERAERDVATGNFRRGRDL